MKKRYEQIILGAGASGLMLASLLSNKEDTLIIDGNPSPGAKLAVSGGGRCNLTNRYVEPYHFLGDHFFVSAVLSQWDQDQVLRWFEDRGLTTVEEKNHQLFCSRTARQILDIFEKKTKGVEHRYGCKINSVDRLGGYFVVDTSCGRFESKRVVVATGGLSYPRLGATDVGYRIAESFGHEIEKLVPALVGMTLQRDQFFFKDLSGISTEVIIRVGDETVQGDLLFAHKGISGPAVLDASLYWTRGTIEIDFLPRFDWSVLKGSKKQIGTLLPLPKRLTRAMLKHLGLADKAGREMNAEDLDRLKALSSYQMAPAGTFGYSKAEVTNGGIKIEGIDPKSMESRMVKDLYFAGEVLDVTGRLGGYNLQWAFSSAVVCASALNLDNVQ